MGYTVRQSNPDEPVIPPRWQSEVKHIQSDKMWKFNTPEELSAFIYRMQVVESPKLMEILVTEPAGAWLEVETSFTRGVDL